MTQVKKFDHKMLIDGKFIESIDGERFERISPSHDQVVGSYPLGKRADAKIAIAAARKAFDKGEWPKWSGAQRAAALRKVADLIDVNKEELALIEVLESGKPISQARDEMNATVGLWYYAATLAQHSYGDSHNAIGEDYLGIIVKEPIGVVGCITPWNFPLLIVSQKLPYALAVGCTAVVKPSQLTTGTTLKLAQYITEAGIPAGVVNVVSGYGEVGAEFSENPDVDMVTFTGSTTIGKRVMAAAAETMKKVELELGGKNPQIIMNDADLEAAVDATVFGVYFNQGECCNSGSRILVQRGIAKEFIAKVVEKSKQVPVGDPLDPNVLVGSIASDAQLETIEKYVGEGKANGAELLLGGGVKSTAAGRFYEPTIFAGVKKDMSIAKEEIFGPVLSILEFDTLEEAIDIANSTLFGLSSGIWTKDINSAIKFSKAVRSGTVWVNCWMDGFPEMSFGGYKESGIGRELGRHAVDEFTELKTIAINTGERKMWIK
jgi:acyl-CoA reductase-like NAD-dependent aldehyde dehydrogenase